MIWQIRRDIVHSALISRPCIFSLATVVLLQQRGRDLEQCAARRECVERRSQQDQLCGRRVRVGEGGPIEGRTAWCENNLTGFARLGGCAIGRERQCGGGGLHVAVAEDFCCRDS